MKKLVGKGKPFHSAVDKTAALLKRKVGTGAEFMKELMGVSGVKPTELQERGLTEIMGMPKMTHDQFISELGKKPAPAVEEKVLKKYTPEEMKNLIEQKLRERALNELSKEGHTPSEIQRRLADRIDELELSDYYDDAKKAAYWELSSGKEPHHGQWTLPGGENYREMLIKAPKGIDNQEKIMELEAKLRRAPNTNNEEQDQWNKLYNQIRDLKSQQAASPEQFQGVSNHFGGEPGILASMRLKDRTGPNGEKLLHLEELQSDWHQQGRDKGYRGDIPDLTPEQKARIEELGDKIRHGLGTSDEIDESKALRDQAAKKIKAVPDAPFKKNWEEMALKRLIHHAAEKGYHGVVVTPGKEQADRYSLAKYIDSIMLVPNPHPNANSRPYYYKAFNKQGDRVADDTVDEQLLSQHIGKEAAEKLLSQEPNSMGERMISGANLVTGDEGMKGFYDKKVPNILNSIGKKYGVKTELHGHKLLGDPSKRADTRHRLGFTGAQLVDMTTAQTQALNAKLDEANAKQLHYFPITEDMRKDVLANGLPLYNKGGTVHMAKEGDMDHMMLEMMGRRMATGGSPTTKGYVTHEPKKPHPEVGTRFKATPQGNLAAMKAFDLMKHEGKGSIVPIPYDATTRDNRVTEVSGHNLINPLVTEAGFDYSLDPTNMAQNIGGASNSGIAKRVQDRVNQAAKEHKGDVFLAPNTMGEDAENFSHHPAHIVLDLMAQRQLNKNTLRALSDDLRGQPELKRNARTGEVTKTYPYTKFLGYDHPNMFQQVIKGGHGLEATPGDLRKKMMERLSLVNMQKLLDYNMGDLKAAILDPELATDPKAYMGRTFVKAQPGAALRPSTHTSYDTDYTGINEGGLGSNRPFEVLMPDVTESIYQELKARPAKTVKTPAQMRAQVVGAIEKRKEKFAQPINARVINNAGLYEEGLKQGEFDPKNVDSVLAYFKRKGGYNKGGAVRKAEGGTIDIKNIGVREAPNMDVKAFISPRPTMKNSLPVGGVFQQAPQQPAQGMTQGQPAQGQPPQGMPLGMPQGMPQGAPPQGMPPQPPSNILQMTPQGQAMSAIKPPQMARGGKVDRDMMMLHVMNRKMKVKHG